MTRQEILDRHTRPHIERMLQFGKKWDIPKEEIPRFLFELEELCAKYLNGFNQWKRDMIENGFAEPKESD